MFPNLLITRTRILYPFSRDVWQFWQLWQILAIATLCRAISLALQSNFKISRAHLQGNFKISCKHFQNPCTAISSLVYTLEKQYFLINIYFLSHFFSCSQLKNLFSHVFCACYFIQKALFYSI
jgi:hypothetical protein